MDRSQAQSENIVVADPVEVDQGLAVGLAKVRQAHFQQALGEVDVLAHAGRDDDAIDPAVCGQDADAAVIDAATERVGFIFDGLGNVRIVREGLDAVYEAGVHVELSRQDRELLGYVAKYLAKAADGPLLPVEVRRVVGLSMARDAYCEQTAAGRVCGVRSIGGDGIERKCQQPKGTRCPDCSSVGIDSGDPS